MKKSSLMTLSALLIAFCAAFICVAAELPPCPLTDAQAKDLLSSISPECKPLAPALAALKRGDLKTAKHVAANYFRKREAALPRIKNYANIERADATVRGEITEVDVTHTFPNSIIDWHFNATEASGIPFNPEWTWQLNRMTMWDYLSGSYRKTKDEKYARTFVSHLRTWAKQCPRPKDNGCHPGSAWRTIECGIRLKVRWPETFREMANSPSVTDDDILLYFYCSREQMRHVMQYPSGGNWLLMEMDGAYVFAADNPEFAESKAVRAQALKVMTQEVKKQFMPDGAQFELSPAYHVGCVYDCAELLQKAEEKGLSNEVPKEYRDILVRAGEYAVKIMTPARGIPLLNDCGPKPLLRDLKRSNIHSAVLDWATQGADPRKNVPKFTSCYMPYAGLAVFRSGWQLDANVLYFDMGPLGLDHSHEDRLGLILYGYGEELLYDDGGGQYEDSETRDYAWSSFDHSVIIIDGKGQSGRENREQRMFTKPLDAHFTVRPGFESAWSEYTGKKSIVTHRRQVIWIKPDLYLICDRLLPRDNKEHRYEARWQVDTTKMEDLLPGSGILKSKRDKGKANLVVAPLLKDTKASWVSGKATKPMGGLYVYRGASAYRPATTVSHERRGKGSQAFLTLLQPVKSGSPSIKSISYPGPKAVKVVFTNGKTLSVTLPDDAQKLPVWMLR